MRPTRLLPAVLAIIFGSALYAWQADTWGPVTSDDIKSIAAQMMDSTWSPPNQITNYDGSVGHPYYAGTTYTGELYTNSNHQNWTEFFNSVSNAAGSTAYGNNCAGFVNIAWRLPALYSIPGINSNLGGPYFYALGENGDGQFVSLLPGDAFYTSGHIFLFGGYNSDGTISTMEQVPPAARRRVWSWNALKNFRPVRRNLLLDGGFTTNDRVQTSSDAGVRSCPSFGCGQTWTAPIAAQGTIVDGPTTAERYRWWKVQYDDYATAGWTTEGYLKKLIDAAVSCAGSDSTAPTGSLTINLGNYTNSRAVILNLSCTGSDDSCASMRFSTDNSTWSAWEPFTVLKNWVLSSGDGLKTVSAQFADTCGNASTSSSSSITLQTPAPDLVVSSLIAPPAASAGATINLIDTTANTGLGGACASTTTFFVSTNGVLDSSDVVLGSRAVSPLAAGAKDTGTTAVTLPSGISPGILVILARANSTTATDDCNFIGPCGSIIESSRLNNVKMAKVEIGPDLVISKLSVSMAGMAININDTTQNIGADPADSSTTSFYLSANTSVDSTDPILCNRSVPGLSGGASSAGNSSATIPSSITPGTYYVIAQADASNTVVEANANNNTKFVALKLLPDLMISSLNVPAAASAGLTINVGDSTTNIGSAVAAASTNDVYLSRNTVLDSGAVLLGNRSVAALDAGAGDSGSTSVTIPSGTTPGKYNIIVRANDSNAVMERSYSNNVKYKAITIQ